MRKLLSLTAIVLLVSSLFASTSEEILVKGGSFLMGTTWREEGVDNEAVRRIYLNYDYYIGKYEVTFDEYGFFSAETGRSLPDDAGWGRGSRPVINVSWWDAIDYCNWLSLKEGLPLAYDFEGNLLDALGNKTTDPSEVEGYRLPTDAEWEFAARGGNLSKGYTRSGGNSVDSIAWYKSNSENMTHPVGTKAPNELGIYDMSGNVWEWVSDYHINYSSLEETNPYVDVFSAYRVKRGGSWIDCPVGVSIDVRSKGLPGHTITNLGFRICRSAK
ncbi:MAG: SUMF1/EgtB/PvdO family nonheme iron enzyme [Mesotoga sp.]|nr:SUMF1/EgtB/PvdO family nonheme iron enzyme [Mesotoga sp.]